jgi:hypothetical protein
MAGSCSACGRSLGKQYIRAESGRFHPQCFCCARCGQRIQGEYRQQQNRLYHPRCKAPEASAAAAAADCARCDQAISGSYTRYQEQPYHDACYAEIAPRCALCQQALSGKYLIDPWGQCAHPAHAGHKTEQCHACGRFIGVQTTHGGVRFGDGRTLCGLCQISEVSQPAEIEQLKADILAQLHGVGFDYIPRYIAVTLADQRLLNQRLGISRHANSQGLTKTLEKRENGQLVYREHSIFVLHGLPRLLFCGVLAHELLHVWLNDRGLNQRSDAEVEGFCNLGSALIFQQDSTPLGAYLLQRLESDVSPVYGEGYRQMRARLQRSGWAGVISHMQQPPGLLERLGRALF